MKTLVIGGTGMVGSMVAAGLMKQGVGVRVMSRSPEKLKKLPPGAERVRADLDDPHSLGAAFDKADSVFLLTAVGPGETDEGLLAVFAAKAAGVKKIVHMSVVMPAGSESIPHFRSKLPIEKAVKESGIAYTILRPNHFFQNDLRVKDAILRSGVYPAPIGKRGLNRVDARDIADCAVNALMKTGYGGETYELHGPDALTGEGIARSYTRHLGREIRYSGDDLNAWAEKAQTMMPEFLVSDLRIMYAFFQEYGVLASKDELEKMQKLLGRKPRTFDEFVKEIAVMWGGKVPKAA